MDLVRLREFETLSPFEIKDELIKLAKKASKTRQSAFLNAGRGNPNGSATPPREAFFLLGQFALTESTRVMKHPAGLGGMPQSQGIAGRLEEWLTTHADMPGAPFLASMVDFAVKTFGFTAKSTMDARKGAPGMSACVVSHSSRRPAMPWDCGIPPRPAGCFITRVLSVRANWPSRKKASRGGVALPLGLPRPALRNADCLVFDAFFASLISSSF